METTSDTFKLKIPEFVQLSFPLRFLPVIRESVQILERTQQLCQSGEGPPPPWKNRERHLKCLNMKLNIMKSKYPSTNLHRVADSYDF